MIETKKTIKFFTAAEYDKEEQYLTKMSSMGWHFVNCYIFFYIFEKGDRKSYVYQLDFKEDIKEDFDNYITMYSDLGWERVFEYPISKGAWIYFRKESEYPDQETLFSDNESRLTLLERIRKVYAIFLPLFLCLFAPAWVYLLGDDLKYLFIPYIAAILVYIRMFAVLNIKINKLKDKLR